MRKFLFLIPALLTTSALCAQTLDAFKQQLAAPAEDGARVVVSEYGKASQAISQASRNAARTRVRGYRVGIFFDNGQDGRSGAFAAKSLFETTYPGIRVHLIYESPYYKVTVGDCLTSEEAIILKGRVSATFPKAFIKSEELAVADLVR